MIIRSIRLEEKSAYNQVVDHPLQSWEWGDFRKTTNVEVERVGFFQSGQLSKALQVTFHPIPHLGGTVGYFPKGTMPDEEQLAALRQLGEKHNAVFIKLEPNIAQKVSAPSAHHAIADFLEKNGAKPGKSLFTRHSFILDLKETEEKLFANLKSKTRYNVRLAHKKGVQIIEDSSKTGLETYLKIMAETTKRQAFYAHSPEYFTKMWEKFSGTDFMRIFHAVYEGKTIVSWIMFVFNDTLYYPYGASSSAHREVMASNLMMWEMIRYGKSQGCTKFDMWGSLGPDPSKKDPWYGFHKFKEGYGGDLVEFVGSYDLVLNPIMYKIVTAADTVRWKILRLKAKLFR